MKKKNKLGRFITLWGARKTRSQTEMDSLDPYIDKGTRQKWGLFLGLWMRIKPLTRWRVVSGIYRHLKERI